MSVVGFGQISGSLSGSVVDQNQASLSNATVKVFLSGGKDPVLTGTTNNDGRFVFGSVRPETYNVTIEANGFNTVTYRQAIVSGGRETALPPFELKVQAVTEVVEVIANEQAIQVENAQVSTTITSVQLNNLPVLGRQVSNLFATQPGVTQGGA
jgi:hypothetical protein